MMNRSLIILCIFIVSTITAQSKFHPPKMAPKPDSSSQAQSQQQAEALDSEPASPVPATPQSAADSTAAATQAAKGAGPLPESSVDSVALPIPDSIVIPLVDFNNQPIQDVLRLLSAPYGVNMSVDANLKAKVTIRLNKIKLKEAIAFIVRENGYHIRVRNSIIEVYQPAPPPPPPAPKPKVVIQKFDIKDNMLSVDLKSANLDSVIRWIALRAGQNIIPERGMKMDISAFFSNMPLEKGLKLLFETNGLELSMIDGLYHLIPSGGGFNESSIEKPSRVKYFVGVKDGKISFNVSNATVNDMIKEIARQANLQIYMYGDINGSITAKVDSITIEEAFESLLRNTASTFWLSRGIYFFADKTAYEKKLVDVIPVNYLQAEEIIPLLPQAVTTKATIKTIKEYNAIIIEASTSDIIDQARDFVTLLDKPIAQVLIEAWVVEVSIDKLRQYGLKVFTSPASQLNQNWSYYPTLSAQYNRDQVVGFMQKYLNVSSAVTSILPTNFSLELDALENEGITNLISKPQIATLNGHSATITIGTTQYYYLQKSTVVPGSNSNVVETSQNEQKVDINMTLSVTPWVTSNDEVTMDIAPSFDVPGASSNSSLPPVVNRRSLNSKVRVKSGEMIILGGLIKAEVDKTTDKVPFLGSIPILGWFFSTKSTEIKKTQLMIYLVPHVYYGSERSIDPTTVDFKSDKPPMTKQEVAAQKKPWWHFW